jgi:membrane protease YdiL (CAAX protease family)
LRVERRIDNVTASTGAIVQSAINAVRAVTIVFGITALAAFLNQLLGNSGLREFLLLHQLAIPGSLYLVGALQNFSYGIMVLSVAYIFAANYWDQLFPDRIRWTVMGLSLLAGVVFAMFLNHPAHVFLFDVLFGQPKLFGGQTSDSVVGGIFSGLRQSQSVLTMPAFATMLLTPFIEELTDRGILFKEAEALALWKVALLSLVIFCFSHYAIGGVAKVLAVAPAAILFVTIRVITKSFVYSTAAHIGINFAALMKLQVW